MNQEQRASARPVEIALAAGRDPTCRVEVCLLGGFRLRCWGGEAPPRLGAKSEALLVNLALAGDQGLPREVLLERLWPDADPQLARQSLNSLVHALRRVLGPRLGGEGPVLTTGAVCRLNAEAGVGVDVARFDQLADAGDRYLRIGDLAGAARLYARAVDVYQGELSGAADIHAVVERERLRSRYMHLLAHLADDAFARGDPAATLGYAQQVLRSDPCREDAHRLAMRCYVRLGERSQALRQYRLCETAVRGEFEALPEPATTTLFQQVLRDPESV